MPEFRSQLSAVAHPLELSREGEATEESIAKIVERIGDKRLVLIGEASHGTHEFYSIRAAITRTLIEERGFRAVIIEGDWPDSRRVDRWARGLGTDVSAEQALSGFKRFPQWMWRNTVVREFVEWIRANNTRRDAAEQCGFFGMDLYSLHSSVDAVLRYLESVDPPAAARARHRYSCFEMSDDPQAYGYAASRDVAESCEDGVVRQLAELRHCMDDYVDSAGNPDDFFSAEQNARLVANAERYYRSMFRGRMSSWNLRDMHMAETIDAVLDHLADDGNARVVVWAHNSHLGDARATEMGRRGELNVGQLMRQRFPNDALLIGFTTFDGTVTAARDWGSAAERKNVRPGMQGSIELLLHDAGTPNFLLDLREHQLPSALLERAIGVIYRPETERQSHYFSADASRQFDLLIHIDRTRALEPLERNAEWNAGEVPDTFPSGL